MEHEDYCIACVKPEKREKLPSPVLGILHEVCGLKSADPGVQDLAAAIRDLTDIFSGFGNKARLRQLVSGMNYLLQIIA